MFPKDFIWQSFSNPLAKKGKQQMTYVALTNCEVTVHSVHKDMVSITGVVVTGKSINGPMLEAGQTKTLHYIPIRDAMAGYHTIR